MRGEHVTLNACPALLISQIHSSLWNNGYKIKRIITDNRKNNYIRNEKYVCQQWRFSNNHQYQNEWNYFWSIFSHRNLECAIFFVQAHDGNETDFFFIFTVVFTTITSIFFNATIFSAFAFFECWPLLIKLILPIGRVKNFCREVTRQ